MRRGAFFFGFFLLGKQKKETSRRAASKNEYVSIYEDGEYRLFYDGGDTGTTGDIDELKEKAEEDRESEYDELAREDRRNAEEFKEENSTKFSGYKLPGGTDYREHLLTLPESGTKNVEAREIGGGWFAAFKDGKQIRDGVHWRVSATEQRGGNANGIDIEGEARAWNPERN